MTLKFNPIITDSATYGLINIIRSFGIGSSGVFYFYPNTVPFPSSCPTSVTAGHILSISITTSSVTLSGGSLILGSYIRGTTTGAGTISWWHCTGGSVSTRGMASDSIGVSGQNTILTLSNLNVSAGEVVLVTSLNMKIVST